MTWTWLERIDPADHANRFYLVGVQPSLFDDVALIRIWGSRESGSQRLRVEAQPDWDTARERADRVIRGKVRQKDAYRIVGGYEPPGLGADDGAKGER
jgi:predicted DNA-binding WGR domain protein